MRITAKFENVRATATPEPQPKAASGASAAARNLALAHRIAALIDQGLIADYTAAARLLGVSQPRLTHLMGLLLLAPEIQAAIVTGTIAPGDKQLRQLARIAEWPAQLDRLAQFTAAGRTRRTALSSTPTSFPLPQTPTANR